MAWDTLQALSYNVAWTLLHFLWQGALVGGIYLFLVRLTSTTRQQHALALVALVVLLTLPAVTFHQLAQAEPAALLTDSTLTATAGVAGDAMVVDDTQAAPASTSSWSHLLVFGWLAGALVIALRLLRDWRLLRRAIRTGTEPPAELATMLQRQIERVGIRRHVRMRLTARITSAGVYGWLRPVILLPTALALCMPRDQLETLLAHELAHVRRADFLANSLALLARTLLYFHPVVHRVCRDLERAREQLCDDLVVSLDIDRIKYARALSAAETFRQQVQVPVPLLTATGGELSERVHRILDIPTAAHSGRERAPLLLALTAITVALVGLGGVDTTRMLSVARPEFQAVYLAFSGTPAPSITAPDLAPAELRPALPALMVAERIPEAPPIMPALLPSDESMAPVPAAPTASVTPAPGFSEQVPVVGGDEQMLTNTSAMIETPVVAAPATPNVPDTVIDSTDANDALNANVSAPASSPRVLRRVAPEYPRSARWDGVEGSVTLAYRIDADGSPRDIRVIAATPAGLFEQATTQALRRWRFEPGGQGEYQQSFDFLLGRSDDRCEPQIGTRICRPARRD
jgi:bla regulator protein BlaR1